eukprot:TRINITY_DN390_c0_g1_i2.p1 TRINITY_DN390_c0_g1~~TRINITY_DN390_c0_g1_i2.p1  ORF type:complete len:109 (-),score=13.10 TRINITY_DN390_c0_g1_i2:148-474(-)
MGKHLNIFTRKPNMSRAGAPYGSPYHPPYPGQPIQAPPIRGPTQVTRAPPIFGGQLPPYGGPYEPYHPEPYYPEPYYPEPYYPEPRPSYGGYGSPSRYGRPYGGYGGY